MTFVEIIEAPPLLTIQDAGRPGCLKHGISASGPMDRSAYFCAGEMLASAADACFEFGTGKLVVRVRGGPVSAAFAGGTFELKIDGKPSPWTSASDLTDGATIEIVPGTDGNFGLIRFSMNPDVPVVIGSRATNLVAGLGGLEGRALHAGDRVSLILANATTREKSAAHTPIDADHHQPTGSGRPVTNTIAA